MSPSPAQLAETFSIANAAPDDAWNVTSTITSRQDRHFSLAEEESVSAHLEPPESSEQEPVALDNEFGPSNAEAEEFGASISEVTDSVVLLSTDEQFQAYMAAGQQAKAEEWLSHLVTGQPDHAVARELFGSLLEAKGDTAGAALQYSRALELLLAHPQAENQAQQVGLYAKVKELASASPLVAKWASIFSPKLQVPVPAVEKSVSAPSGNTIELETHYTLGVAYKNMGLLDEAKEEFSLSMQSHEFFADSCLMIAMCLKEQGESR